MDGADFILGINLLVAGLLAAAFLAVAAYEGARRPALHLAAAYGIGMAYLGMELAITTLRETDLAVTAAFAIFLLATIVFNMALASKYAVALSMWPMAVFMVITAFAVWLTQDMERQSLTRMMAYQFPYAVMQFVGVGIIWRGRSGWTRLDRFLMAVLAVNGAHFFGKAVCGSCLGGMGYRSAGIPSNALRHDLAVRRYRTGAGAGIADADHAGARRAGAGDLAL